MNSLNLLILNLDPSDDLGTSLRKVLSHAADVDIDLLHQSIDPNDPDAVPYTSTGDGRVDAADVVFLVSPRTDRSRADAIISHISSRRPNLPIIMVSEETNPDEIIGYLRTGVADHLAPPLRAVDIIPRLWRLVEHARQRSSLLHAMKTRLGLRQLIGESPVFRQVVEKISIIAQSDVGVLISGETGTGKEMVARAIHYLGPRAGKPFIPVNCGAIPAELAENELFGHVRGAFTGAHETTFGLFNESEGGTIFLDEIESLSLQLQVKLLRVLQEKEYRPVGSATTRKADVRVIAATNTDLESAMRQGTFRQDLYYRLNIVRLSLPPLRERTGDIALLARHFVSACGQELDRAAKDFTPEALKKLSLHRWPGNVRELENVTKRAVMFSRGATIQAQEIDLPVPDESAVGSTESFRAQKARIVAEFESRYMREVLQAHAGNITKAANACGKNRRCFFQLLKKHKIDVSEYKTSRI